MGFAALKHQYVCATRIERLIKRDKPQPARQANAGGYASAHTSGDSRDTRDSNEIFFRSPQLRNQDTRSSLQTRSQSHQAGNGLGILGDDLFRRKVHRRQSEAIAPADGIFGLQPSQLD